MCPSQYKKVALPTKTLAKWKIMNKGIGSQVLKKEGVGRSFPPFNSIWRFLIGDSPRSLYHSQTYVSSSPGSISRRLWMSYFVSMSLNFP